MKCWLVIAGLFLVGNAHAQALMRDFPGANEPVQAPAEPAAGAKRAAPPPQTVFRSGVDLVALNVVVTDGRTKFVTGLQADNFNVFEDGVPQDVTFFSANPVPLDLAILLDTSASMSDKLHEVQQAATGFASSLRAGDRAMVVDIKDATRVLQPLTADLGAAKAAIAGTRAKGGTALLNGIYLTLKELTGQRGDIDEIRRQAIVVLSDGDDTASLVSFDDVLEEAKRTGIAVYTISLRSPYALQIAGGNARSAGFAESDFSMRTLAQETGARSFFPAGIGELASVYDSIAAELANQYALAYIPTNLKRDGTFRRITVRVTDHPGATPRTRSGYMAPRADRRSSIR